MSGFFCNGYGYDKIGFMFRDYSETDRRKKAEKRVEEKSPQAIKPAFDRNKYAACPWN